MQHAESYQAITSPDCGLAAIEAICADDERMAEIHQRIARRLAAEADGGEMIDTLAQSYPLLRAITHGVSARDMGAGLLDRLADLYRLVSRMSDEVTKEVGKEAAA